MADIDPLSLDFAVRHPDSFARVLGRGETDEIARIIDSLSPDRKASIIGRLPTPVIARLLESERQPAEWLVDAPFDDAVILLSRLPREKRLALVNRVEDRDRKRRLLRHEQYPAHTVGSLVSDVPRRLQAESAATDVVAELREPDAEARGPVVVVDADGRYLGVLDRWRLLLCDRPTGQVGDYLLDVRAVRPETPTATVVLDEQWHTRNWLPVIDHRDRVLGAVSRERVFRAAGAHFENVRGASDVLIDLLADLVHVCEAVLVKALSRRNVT